MFLAVDVGNSNVRCAVFSGPEIVSSFRMAADANASVAAYRHSIHARIGNQRPLAAGISSVVPSLTGKLLEAVREEFMILPTVISSELDLPIRLDYQPASSLGTDRVCAAAAAWLRYGSDEQGAPRPVLVLDAGTATTFELIVDGTYLGGAISAGPGLMARAMASGTGQLPAIDPAVPDSPVGRTTVESLQSGIMFSFIDGSDRMIARMSAELDTRPFVVATGGWGALLAEQLERIDRYDEDLVLDGIARICLGDAIQ
jgi:type III pantothenate kinase